MGGREDIQGFVLAGGKSSRMGQDKARLERAGKPLVLRAAEILRPFVREVTLLGPPERYSDLGLPVLADQRPEQGPLAAVCTGLLHSTAEWNVFLACDLPLLSSRFLQLLVERIRDSQSDAVVPRTEDGWQPLCAAYHSRCCPAFVRALQENRRSLIGLFEEIQVEAITPGEMAAAGLRAEEFANMNTPEDWARIAERPKGSTKSC
jgi:molybdopterin-guanine dinucleotide biosynthesis protein A